LSIKTTYKFHKSRFRSSGPAKRDGHPMLQNRDPVTGRKLTNLRRSRRDSQSKESKTQIPDNQAITVIATTVPLVPRRRTGSYERNSW